VSVRRVGISGVSGPEAGAIDAALSRAARHMTTLDVRVGALRAAVAPFRVVRDVQASPVFPHDLRIRVIEQLPVAALTIANRQGIGGTAGANGGQTAVAADGVILGPALLAGSLPAVSGAYQLPAGERVSDPKLLEALAVLGAAPAPLASTVTRVFTGSKGVTVVMRKGLLAYFGDATRPHAKWLSLARVLADPGSEGASYVDVRLPERPAAGFAGGAAPRLGGGAGESGSASEPAAGHAAPLAPPIGAPSAGAAAGREAASGGASSAEGTAGAPAETGPAAPAQTSPSAPAEAPSAPAETPSTSVTPGR
jgi:cell division protein FtsQ